MDSGHRKEVQVFYRNPTPIFISVDGLAMISLQGEFEVGKSLVKCSHRLFYFDIHSHFFLEVVS